MNTPSQRGSAIIMLFIAVALFGMISYAFLQGSRGNTNMIIGEADKAAVMASQDCSNAVSLAIKRLAARGCGDLVSTAADGSNTNPGAPSDGSCSIYHPNGGGVKDCGLASSPADPCLTGPIGTVCTNDGAVYIGDVGGNRIYAAAADEAVGPAWKTSNTATAGTGSATDGLANTAAIVAAGAGLHPVGLACNAKSPPGTWYLPARNELQLVWTNRVAIDLAARGFNTGTLYWSSTDNPATQAWTLYLTNGNNMGIVKVTPSLSVRCVRR